jgi:hypothetical protein
MEDNFIPFNPKGLTVAQQYLCCLSVNNFYSIGVFATPKNLHNFSKATIKGALEQYLASPFATPKGTQAARKALENQEEKNDTTGKA